VGGVKHDLVDNFLVDDLSDNFGRGETFACRGTIAAAFKVTESIVGSTGVILVNYERAGAVQTGTIAE
jgi:hypothetical protein